MGARTGRAGCEGQGATHGPGEPESRDFAFCQIFWAASQGTALEWICGWGEQASISAPSQPWKQCLSAFCLSGTLE